MQTTQEWKIGDCLELMKELSDDSVDIIVTDPPYGYSFMGKDWDRAVPTVDVWTEALRVLKPGAFAFIMSAPRQDVLAHNLVNLSDAGFETGYSSIYWCFSSGFPKSANISKLVDKRFGAERKAVGKKIVKGGENINVLSRNGKNDSVHAKGCGAYGHGAKQVNIEVDVTEPSTPEAKALVGSYGGFQPKPAVEVVMVVMKPLEESTYIDQALANQHGIVWLDDGRIPYQSDDDESSSQSAFNTTSGKTYGFKTGIGRTGEQYNTNPQGRFPANLLVCDDVLNDGTKRNSCKSSVEHPEYGDNFKFGGGVSSLTNQYSDSGSFSRYFDLDSWWGARIKLLPKEAQKTFPFMIIPKASKSEKGENCEHPTVKPVKLFSWLMTIGSREGDLVCDPFLGSGTTLEAGRHTSRRVIGFELDPQWEHLYADRCMTHTPTLDSYF